MPIDSYLHVRTFKNLGCSIVYLQANLNFGIIDKTSLIVSILRILFILKISIYEL